MKQGSVTLIFIFSFISHITAQYNTNRNKVWAFGLHAGVDFTSGFPVSITTNSNTAEGCADVSDALGNLLFYTDGKVVHNQAGAVMPHGDAIVPVYIATRHTTQAALIVPVISNANQYYVFSLQNYAGAIDSSSQLFWSKVDMTLAGGLGDVMSGFAGVPLEDSMSEKMIAVPGGGATIWVITHRKNVEQFLAYPVTMSGIGTPVISSVGVFSGFSNYSIGELKATHGGRRLVAQYYGNPGDGTGGSTELYDFDPCTGIVSNCQVLDPTYVQFGAEFSPDDSKLYVQQIDFGGFFLVNQYDVSLPTTSAICASKTIIAAGIGWHSLKLGPDGKIYFTSLSGFNFLDCVNYPNLPGVSCGYSSEAVDIWPNTVYIGLPGTFVTLDSSVNHTRHDTTTCVPFGGSITIYPHDPASSYLWFDGSTAPYHMITSPGTYWVYENNGCSGIIDTINVIPYYDSFYHHTDTLICVQTDYFSCTLSAPSAGIYAWHDGSAGSTNTVHVDGVYWVACFSGCAINFDSFNVVFRPSPNPIAGPDTICIGNSDPLSDITADGFWSSHETSIASIDSTNGTVTGISAGTSSISYILASGCAQSKNITVIPCATSIAEINWDNKIDVYPNPANDECVISWNGIVLPGIRMAIYDVWGTLICAHPLEDNYTTISVKDIPPGIYQCRIEGNGLSSVTKKLVVMR